MNKGIILILIIAYLLRSYNINFPPFTADEARVALRGYTLATEGRDELSRKFPIIFNSLSDYQLPLTSYATAIGVKLFGKSDFGVRIPFVLLGTLSVWLVYKLAGVFNPSEKFRLLAAFIAAFSPTLIFLSRIPNETIFLTCLFLLLFYILTRKNFNFVVVLVIFSLLLLTSKIAWFTLLPFTVFTLMFLQKDFSKKSKLTIFISLSLTAFTIFIFLKIPQSVRSLMENNFPSFSSETIKNGIDKLRGQGIESGWPPLLTRILFNKLAYLYAGFLHWLSHLQPAVFFSQFDPTGKFGLISMGAWSKVLIIPVGVAIIHIVRNVVTNRLHFFYFVILTFPLIFVYPLKSPDITALILPFMAIFITTGLVALKKYIRYLILAFMILEVLINFTLFESQIKNTNMLRPGWIKDVVHDAYILSKKSDVALSDDIADDLAPFIGWYTPASLVKTPVTDFPYKVRQNKLPHIQLIGFDNKFRSCGIDDDIVLILSRRDLDKVREVFEVDMEKTYKDTLNESKAYKLKSKACIE